MKLAKPQVDIGLSTNDPDPMLAFWQNTVGLKLDHVLPVRRGQHQHRHDAMGSVVKINHHTDPLPDAAPTNRIDRRDRQLRELVLRRKFSVYHARTDARLAQELR